MTNSALTMLVGGTVILMCGNEPASIVVAACWIVSGLVLSILSLSGKSAGDGEP